MNHLEFTIKRYLGKIRRIYFMALPEDDRDYHRSRNYFIAADTAAQTIGNMVGGSYLTSLMLAVGFSDASIGTLTSMASLAALFQLFTMQTVNKMKKRKFFICMIVLLKFLFTIMFLVPLFHMPERISQIMIALCFFLAQSAAQIVGPATSDWIASLIPLESRGKYFAKKDAILVFVIVTVLLIVGVIMDALTGPKQNIGFLVCAAIVFVMVIINFWALSKMHEPRTYTLTADGKEVHGTLAKRYFDLDTELEKTSFLIEFKEAFKSKDFRIAFITTTLWMTSFYIASPFNSSYQLKELALPFTFLQITNFASNLIRIAITHKMGKLGDYYGMAFIYKYSLVGILLFFVIYTFTVPSNAYLFTIAATLFSALGWSFAGSGLFGVQLEMLDENKRTIQFSILSSLTGTYGFLVSVIAGQLLDFIQHHRPTVFGVTLYAQQVTNALGVFFLVLLILYLKFKVQVREKELRQK